MKLKVNYFENIISLNDDNVQVIEIENKKTFYRFISDLYAMKNDDKLNEVYFYNELNGDESIYVKIGETRQAYVAKFNNESASTLYIDATTGEIIGGDMILGGEY